MQCSQFLETVIEDKSTMNTIKIIFVIIHDGMVHHLRCFIITVIAIDTSETIKTVMGPLFFYAFTVYLKQR